MDLPTVGRYTRPMKTPQVVGLVIAAVAATAAIQEVRISRLKKGLADSPAASMEQEARGSQAAAETSGQGPVEAPLVTKRDRPPVAEPDPSEPAGDEDEPMVKTVRKMWENPAGKAMMNQGVRIAVAMMYEDFIETMDLTKEESDYFKDLLGNEMVMQQELGMKMMSASPEERMELAKDLEERRKENEEAVRKFLNNDEDFQAYTDYKDRAPERQQLEGVRAAMQSKGTTLDPDTEAKLVEAMYDARKNAGTGDFSGPDALEEMAKGNMTEVFEENWQRQDEALMKEVGGILDEDQLEAFREFRGQMKEMQMMGLKMAEKMMGGEGKEE